MSKTETSLAPLNPLQALNSKIIEAKAASNLELQRLRRAWVQHQNSVPVLPATLSVAELVAAQTAHGAKGNALRSASQNYRPEVFVSAILDVDENKPALVFALRHLEGKYGEALKRKAAAPKPTNESEGRHLFQAQDDREPLFVETQRRHEAPSGGLYGVPEPLNITAELSRLQVNIAAFPLAMTFEQITGSLNTVASALREQEPRPAPPKRCDRPFIVPAHL